MKRALKIVDRLSQLLADCTDVFLSTVKRQAGSDSNKRKRVTFIQFGSYEEAYWRFEHGGAENYYAQKYSVDFVGALPTHPAIESVTVICVSSDAEATVLPNGVRTMGIEVFCKDGGPRFREIVALVVKSRPTHLIVMTPCIPMIACGVRFGCQVLPLLADSFRATGLKATIEYKLLARLLNASAIQFVANHNLAASLDLSRIGVIADKVIPYDLPAVITPRDFETKKSPPSGTAFRLIYVGAVTESKGVGDVIGAVGHLRRRGIDVTLTIIGAGDIEAFQGIARGQNIQDSVFFLGLRGHPEVIAEMRSHDAVVVPSHWAYPEGLPMTLYEALCTRTPLLTSDHPMFALKIRDGYNALVFPERNPEACANRIEKLLRSPELYLQLSSNALGAGDEYLCPLKYDQLISAFLGLNSSLDLRQFSLANCYPESVGSLRPVRSVH